MKVGSDGALARGFGGHELASAVRGVEFDSAKIFQGLWGQRVMAGDPYQLSILCY